MVVSACWGEAGGEVGRVWWEEVRVARSEGIVQLLQLVDACVGVVIFTRTSNRRNLPWQRARISWQQAGLPLPFLQGGVGIYRALPSEGCTDVASGFYVTLGKQR